MIYTIRHVTRFRYSAPITESALQVRMQPRREGRQHCLSFELTTNPEARILSFQDYLGNTVHSFDIPVHHQELTVTAQSLVSVMPSPLLPAGLDRSAWDELDALAADSDIAEMLVPSSFARPTELLRGFARELRLMRRDDPLSLLHEINHGVHRALIYRPESTRVDSPIDEALQMRRGVCQDYAHIMIALVRGLGIPCRYVSGYLYHRFTENDRRHPDASHAWVEALLPGLDWIGFDPANDVVAGERHRLAAGVGVCGRIVDKVPVDRAPVVRSDGAADQMNLVAERDARNRAAGFGQTPQRVPAFAVEREGAVVRRAVLLEEAPEGVEPVPQRRHPDVVRSPRQLRKGGPGVRGGVVGVVIGSVDPLLGVAADEMHAAAILGRPCHLGARDGQRRPRFPPARHAPRRRGALRHRMLLVQLRKADAPGRVQALELP